MGETERDFWTRVTIPVNADWEQNGFQFVNPVHVQDMFAEATGLAAQMGREAEAVTETLANLTYSRDGMERNLARLRRQILADHWAEMKSHVNSAEKVDAFILAAAGAHLDQMLKYEADIEALTLDIGRWKPRLDKINARLKQLDKNMDYAKQFLDYDKMLARLGGGNGPR